MKDWHLMREPKPALPPSMETVKTCGHVMDLLEPQRRAMLERPGQQPPNAILVGQHTKVAIMSRHDAPYSFQRRYRDEPEMYYGYHVITTTALDQLDYAYLPSLPSKEPL